MEEISGSVFVATSMDGYIARRDGGIDWLPAADAATGEDYGYQAFMDSVDALVMGRNTYELAASFGSWPFGSKPVVVLTHRPLSIPAELLDAVQTLSAPPHEVMRQLAARGMRHVYVDGGRTIQSFLEEGLIRRLTITRVPILLGNGIPLFGRLSRDVQLRHLATQTFANGLVQSSYEVV